MGRNIIPFELRPGKDDDIEKALKEATTKEVNRSAVIREALRFYFNQKSHLKQQPQHTSYTDTPSFKQQDIPIELQKTEKSDTQLDAALDDLLKF